MKRKKRTVAWALILALVVQCLPVMAVDNTVSSNEINEPIISAEQTERKNGQEDPRVILEESLKGNPAGLEGEETKETPTEPEGETPAEPEGENSEGNAAESEEKNPEEILETDQTFFTVSGIVFLDENKDGKYDEVEETVKNICVKVYDAASYTQENAVVLTETVVDENGKYEFPDLKSGKYRIEVYLPEQEEGDVKIEGVIPEGMEEKLLSGEVDYKIELPTEQDDWVVCIPEVDITDNRELNIGLLKDSSKTDSEETSENVDDKEEISGESGSESSDNAGDSASQSEGDKSESDKSESGKNEGDNQNDDSNEADNNEADNNEADNNEADNIETDNNEINNNKDDNNENDDKITQNIEQNPVGEDVDHVNPEEDMAVAETTTENSLLTALQKFTGEGWSYDIYYVHSNSNKNIVLTEDGNLKYQIEFKANEEIAEGCVDIRVPRALIKQRYGLSLYPSEIAVPEGTPENPTESRVSPFNYYIDEKDLVFFNYEKIKSGSNIAFQVLYRNIDVMELKDGSEWSLESSCTVTNGDDVRTEKADPLTGKVDTTAKLNSISMTPYVKVGKNYYPGLYTEKQIATIVKNIPDKFVNNFNAYRYVVWDVSVHGEATQPWNLYLKSDAWAGTDGKGEIVGFNVPTEKGSGEYEDYYRISDSMSPNTNFQVVIAYPAEKAQAGVEVKNHIEVVMQPIDKLDEPTRKETESSWIYRDYKWTYSGDVLNIRTNGGGTYPSWLNVYRAASKSGQDKGGFSFNINSSARGYEKTHITSGDHLGEVIEGRSYQMVTVDDFVYAYPNTNQISQKNYKILDYEDYYFNSITVTQEDQGYDPWEDTYASPEKPKCDNNGLTVYAMFAESENPNEWTQVAVLPWEDDGTMHYSFSAEDIAKKPWRVKAEHSTTNYSTTCSIQVSMMLRHDSEYLSSLVEDIDHQDKGTKKLLTIENIPGVIGEYYENGNSLGSMGTGALEGYEEPELEEKSQALYRILPMRRNAFVYCTSLQEHAGAGKSGKAWNDNINGRVHLQYNMTAFDGYDVYGEEAVSYLKSEGVQSPGRNEVVFYDLLPYGVKFDPSVEVVAGRITNFDKNHNYQYYPASWDQSQITVAIDSKKDIISNYKNSGRTMVIFHVNYSGADAAIYSNQRWMEGFGVSFGAYYDWKDTMASNDATNIVAFMSEEDRPFLGTSDEVAKDNGIYPASLGNQDEYKILGADIDQDGLTEESVLYAQTRVMDDSVQASVSGIQKLVRADEDRFGIYEKATKVHPGKGYTYDINISNVNGTKSNIVFFDHLDKGAEDLTSQGGVFDEHRWSGTFNGVITTGLTKVGIEPIIYYNADPQAKTASEKEDPTAVLTEDNGWYTAESWKNEGKKEADVKSIAIDMRKSITGESFELNGMQTVTFQIKMTSPTEIREGKAYNVAQYYAEDKATGAFYNVSEAAEVSLDLESCFELVKEFSGEIPDSVKDTAFLFTIYKMDTNGEKSKFRNQEYQLFEKTDGGTWERVGEGKVYATDTSGQVRLKADQKIVFNTPYATSLSAVEEESPFWKQTVDISHPEEDITVQKVTNKYRPVLYVQKRLATIGESLGIENIDKQEFTFRVEMDGKPLAETEFWYVDSVRTDGGIPSKDTNRGKEGVGKTDKNGEFTIRPEEIIALFADEEDCEYKVTETKGYGEGTNWICEKPSVSGTIPYNGTSAKIENLYRWKDLYVIKELRNQDPADCKQKFTFCITDEEGKPVVGKKWVLQETSTGGILPEWEWIDTDVTGITDDQGRLSVACAGKRIRIKDLEIGKSYVIEEVDEKGYEDGDYYEPVDRKKEVTMPLYGEMAHTSFTNDYILRDLSISKVVNYDSGNITTDELESLNKKEFTMTVEIGGELLKDTPYQVTENGAVIEDKVTDAQGQIQIKNGQTVIFEEIAPVGISYKVTELPDQDYPQLFPANKKPHEGIVTKEGASVQFVNGKGNTFIIGKEYVVSDPSDQIEKEYLAKIKKDLRQDYSVELELQVADDSGEYHAWPETNREVMIIDTLTNQKETVTWKAGSTFEIEPWKNICISDMEESTAYRLSESTENQHKVIRYEGDDKKEYTFEICQKLPGNDGAVEGTIQKQPKAVITNEIKNLEIQNEVIKKVLAGDDTVPEGAQLAYRVEAYDGQVWNPAEKIEYIVTDDAGIISDRTEMTGADGMILMHKSANGTPTVEFIGKTVKVHPENPTVGTLRVVEVAERTDASWGRFAGYVDENGKSGVNIWDGIGFANSNTTHEFEVEKVMEEATDDTFTVILEQITSATASPVTDKSQILEKVPGNGIRYEVYDTASGAYLTENITGNKGEIYLKAGQYVKFMLEDGTEWTVNERIPNGYSLKEMTVSGNDTSGTVEKIDPNMSVITTEKPRENLPGITLTKEMVETGVVNADTGKLVQLKEGKVTIPEKIIVEGKRYYVTAIGPSAFQGELDVEAGKLVFLSKLTEVIIPDTVTEVQDEAFAFCGNIKKLILPDSIRKIGMRAFGAVGWAYQDKNDEGRPTGGPLKNGAESFKVSKGVTEIGDYAFSQSSLGEIDLSECKSLGTQVFAYCGNLEKCVWSNHLKEVPEYAFLYCVAPSFDVIIPEGVERIGSSAFMESTFKVKLPDSVKEIGSNAFSHESEAKMDVIFEMPKNLERIGFDAFLNYGISEIIWNEKPIYIGRNAFAGNLLTEVTIPEGVQMDNCVFEWNEKLKTITFPKGMQTIPSATVLGCSNLTDVHIPQGVTRIEREAFYSCTSLKTIMLPETLETIEYEVFHNCKSLIEITIPASVQYIGGKHNTDVFAGCGALREIIIRGKERPLNAEGSEQSGLSTKWGAPDTTPVIWADVQ